MKKVLIYICCIACLQGCTWMVSDFTKLDLRLVAKGDLNLDDNGRPSPLVVRIIELRSTQTFESADFFALYGNEKETLGSDWVASEELELKPGDIKDLKIAISPDSQHLAVLAAYRRLNEVNWRMLIPIYFKEKNQQTLLLSGKGLALARQ